MAIDAERLAMIQENAAFAISELGELAGIDFGLNRESVAWTEGFIERQRESLEEEAGEGLINVLGSYLGEAIIAAAPEALWDDDDAGRLGLRFANGDMVFPFAKVAKQLAGGLAAGESILSFYNVSVDYVAAEKLDQAGESEAP